MASDAEDDKPTPKKPKKTSKSSGLTSDQLQQILKEALMSHAETHTRKTADLCSSITATLEEFLQTFVVLGYDLDGMPITIVNTKTQQEADALSTAVTRFFMKHNDPGV